VYRHEYEGVDETLVWQTASQGLADLRKVCEAELERARNQTG